MRPRRLHHLVALSCLAVALAPAAARADVAHSPTAIGVATDGRTFVGDGDSGQIKVYDASGEFVAVWGSPGQAAGQIGGVISIAVDAAAHVFVLDTYNRVQEFTATGTLVRGTALPLCTRDSAPSAPGLGGLALASSAVFVASPCSDVVYRLGSDLSPDIQWAVSSPRGIYVQNGKVYVARWNGLDVAVYNLAGGFQFAQPIGGQPGDVFVDIYNVLHVSDISHDVIHMFGGDGVEFRTLGRPGANPGDLNDPWAFDVGLQNTGSLSGNLFIADYGNQRIQRWDSYGSTLFARTDDGEGGSTPPPPPPPPPPGARVGVTIGDAATFTGSTAVTLTITPLPGATGVLLSNDGGFGGAVERPVSGDSHYSWTLVSSGAERLPKTVYVRFTGPGVDDTKTFTDDIVLDQTPPSVTSAARSAGARAATVKKVSVHVRARDGLSGVGSLQFAHTRTSLRRANVPYRRSVRVAAADAHFVRAIDKAGNTGRWVKIRRAARHRR